MGILSFLTKKSNYKREGYLTLMDRQTAKDRWTAVEEQVRLGKPSNMKQAVLEADKITDFVLSKMYLESQTMGERLKLAKEKFRGNWEIYDGLWFAHKVRNELVHNINFELPSVETMGIIEKFKKALELLGVL